MASDGCGRDLQSSLRLRVYIETIRRFEDLAPVANPLVAGRRLLHKVFMNIKLRCLRAEMRRRGLQSGNEPRASFDALEIGSLVVVVAGMLASLDDLTASMDSTCA